MTRSMTAGLAIAAMALATGWGLFSARALGEEKVGGGDITYENAQMGNTTFSHAKHVEKNPQCTTCHPDPFAMKKGAKITMAEVYAGKSCGKCHVAGASAFEAKTACAKCHKK